MTERQETDALHQRRLAGADQPNRAAIERGEMDETPIDRWLCAVRLVKTRSHRTLKDRCTYARYQTTNFAMG